jgi:hypothetical protein
MVYPAPLLPCVAPMIAILIACVLKGGCDPCAPSSTSDSGKETKSSLMRADTIPFDNTSVSLSSSSSSSLTLSSTTSASENGTETVARSANRRLIDSLVKLCGSELHNNWRSCAQYWTLLYDIAKMGVPERRHIRSNLMSYLQWYMGNECPYKPSKLACKKLRKKHHDQLADFWKLIALLTRPMDKVHAVPTISHTPSLSMTCSCTRCHVLRQNNIWKLKQHEEKVLRDDVAFLEMLCEDFDDVEVITCSIIVFLPLTCARVLKRCCIIAWRYSHKQKFWY